MPFSRDCGFAVALSAQDSTTCPIEDNQRKRLRGTLTSSAQHRFLHRHDLPYIMSQMPATTASSSSSRFQAIFQVTLNSYQKQTKKNLLVHPLASQLQDCDSTTAILAILQDQVRQFDKSHSGDERLTKWLSPTVNVLSAFSATISGGVGLVRLDSLT